MAEEEKKEVGLAEVWIALKRHRVVAFAIVLACATLAVGYSIYSRTLENEIVVDIGYLGGTRIEEVAEVMGRLRGSYLVQARNRNRDVPHVSGIEAVQGSVILIVGTGRESNSVANFLERIAAELVGKHADMFEKGRIALTNSQSQLRRQVEILRTAIAEPAGGLAIEGGPPNLLGLVQFKPYSQLIETEQRLLSVERQLADPKNQPTTVLRKPLRDPSRFPFLLVAFALFAGAVIGLVIATAAAVALEIGKSIGSIANPPPARG